MHAPTPPATTAVFTTTSPRIESVISQSSPTRGEKNAPTTTTSGATTSTAMAIPAIAHPSRRPAGSRAAAGRVSGYRHPTSFINSTASA